MKEEKALFSFGCAFKSLYVELQLKYSCQLDFTELVPDSSVLVCARCVQDRIYWTDRDRAAVFMANRLSGQDIQTLAENLNDPHDIVVFHQLRQPQGASSPSVAAGFSFPVIAAGMASPPQLMNEPWRGSSHTSVT